MLPVRAERSPSDETDSRSLRQTRTPHLYMSTDAADAIESRPTALRILVVDDHAGMRSVLRKALTRQQAVRVEIVGEAADGNDALTATAELIPDVVLMDVDMPCMNGIEATRRIASQFPAIYIVGWTSCDAVSVDAMHAAGAAVVLSKDAGVAKLVEALQAARS